MTLQRLVTESSTNLADRLVALRLLVEAGEVERAVDARTLAGAEVGSDDDEVEGIADAREVVLLELWV